MKNRKLCIAVAGLGRMGWAHCRAIAANRKYSLVAAMDPLRERGLEATHEFGCAPYSDFQAMLKHKGLEAVLVASPSHLHKKMAIDALNAGLHVFLEKPMALNWHEANRILKVSKQRRRILTVNQSHRSEAYFQQLTKIISSGIIGDVYHVIRGAFQYVRRDDWQALARYGGGMLNNWGVHLLDQILQITGYDLKKVFCNLSLVATLGDAEDVVKVVYETRKGIIGEFSVNHASVCNPYEFIIFGTRGTIEYKNSALIVSYLKKGSLGRKKLNQSLASSGRRYPDDKFRLYHKTLRIKKTMGVNLLDDFFWAIRKNKKPFIRPEEVVAMTSVLDACRKNGGKIKRF